MEVTSLPIKLQPSNIRPIAFRILSKKHGLNINTDALAILTETIGYKFGTDWKSVRSQQFLEEVAKVWKIEDRGLFIDGDGLKQVLKDMNSKSSNDTKRAHRTDTLVDITNDGNQNHTHSHQDKQISFEDKNMQHEERDDVPINWQDYFKVVSPNNQPTSIFDKTRKQFDIVFKNNDDKDKKAKRGGKLESIVAELVKNLPASIESFNNRYYLLSDRLSRNENFQKKSLISLSALNSFKEGKTDSITGHEISLIKNMLGRDGQKFLIFGLLSKNANDEYTLEDETDHIELNLSQAFKSQGLFYCSGMFLLVEGIYSASGGNSNQDHGYIGGCFYVSNIGHPPSERRETSLDVYGNLDFLGMHRQIAPVTGEKITKISKKFKKRLVLIEKTLYNHKLIFVGTDLYLDDFKVLDGLRKFFQKLENSIIESIEDEEGQMAEGTNIPLALVFTGSFVSKPLSVTNSSVTNITNSESYKSNFDNFTTILSKYPNIVSRCKIILIPGKNDPWQSTYSLGSSSLNYFPQSSIPKVFINRLEKLLPKGNLVVSWNPTRINYLSQELVVFKDELMTKLKRNDIIFPRDIQEQEELIAQDDQRTNEERINNLIQNKNTHLPSKIKQARKLVKTILDQGNLQPFLKNLKLINLAYDYSLRIEPLPNVIILNDSSFDNFEVTYNGCKVVNITSVVSLNNRKFNYVEYYPGTKRFEFKDLYF